VYGINGNIVFNSGYYGLLYIVAPGNFFKAPKNDGVVRHHQITVVAYGFINYFGGSVKAANNACTIPGGITGKQAGIIITFLVSRRRPLLQQLYGILYFHIPQVKQRVV